MTVLDAPPAPDPARVMARHLADTRARILEARRACDVPLAAEIRAAADEVRARAFRDSLPAPVQLDGLAAVRLAERGIGVTVRAAQDAGLVRRRGDSRSPLPSPTDLAGAGDLTDFYALADYGDEEFEAAIRACAGQGAMSRAAIFRTLAAPAEAARPDHGWIPEPNDRSPRAAARRLDLIEEFADRGLSSPQIAQETQISEATIRKIAAEAGIEIRADAVVSRTRRAASSDRITNEVVYGLEGLVSALEQVNVADLDPAQKKDWAASLTDSLRALNRFANQINF